MWVNLPALARQKLSPKWTGPFKVLRRLDSGAGDIGVDYELLDQQDPRAKPKIIHYNRLKPYRSPWSANRLPVPPSPSELTVTANGPGPPLLTALSGSRPYVYGHPTTPGCSVTAPRAQDKCLPSAPECY